MDDHFRIEELALYAWNSYVFHPVIITLMNSVRARTVFLWVCIILLLLPFHIFAFLLVAIVACFRLALANADIVIFVFATSILSFYQVPRKVFYIYIAVLAVTGFLQFLRTDSPLRTFLLYMVDLITIDKANLFLRKFSGLHYSNPYTRTWTTTRTIFFPVGYIVPYYSTIEVFKFPIPPDLDFFKREVVVGDCTITIKTLQESITVRSLQVEAPWGDNTVTFNMEDENLGRFVSYMEDKNLGRFVSYLEHVANECKQMICTKSRNYDECRALSIVETIEYFNRGLSLVKLEIFGDDNAYAIN